MSKETKHTPGPWGWEHYNGRAVALSNDTDDVLLSTGNGDGEAWAEIRDADKSLIAAAPDLLSALRAFIHEFDQEPPRITVETYMAAKEALAKAETP